MGFWGTGSSCVENRGEFSTGVSGQRRKRIRGRLVLTAVVGLFLSIFLAGCGGGFFIGPSLSTLYISPAGPTVASSKTVQLVTRGIYSDGSQSDISGSSVTWSSSDPTIATVTSPGGLVTGVGVGTATITATATATIQGTGCKAVVTTSPSIQIQKICYGNSIETLTATVNVNVTAQ
jgi:hypothetical protein